VDGMRVSDSIRILPVPKTPVRCADLRDVPHAMVVGPPLADARLFPNHRVPKNYKVLSLATRNRPTDRPSLTACHRHPQTVFPPACTLVLEG